MHSGFRRRILFCAAAALMMLAASSAWAQGTVADYQRAQGLQTKARGLVVNTPGAVTWIGLSEHFWYPRAVKGGTEFMMVDAAAGSKKVAFDHDKLAAAISSATGHSYTGLTLPFAPQAGRGGGGGRGAAGATPMSAPLTFADDEQYVQFGTGGSMYKCLLTDYTCAREGPIPANAGGRGRGGAPEEDPAPEYLSENNGGDPADGLDYQPFPQQGGAGDRDEVEGHLRLRLLRHETRALHQGHGAPLQGAQPGDMRERRQPVVCTGAGTHGGLRLTRECRRIYRRERCLLERHRG